MSLRWQLEREIVRKLPPFLFSLALTIYWRIHPFRDNAILIPEGDSVHIIKRDMEFFFPIKHGVYAPFVQKGGPTSPHKEFCSLKEGSIVVDAGAEIGKDTLVMAKEIGESGRIIAIEPAPPNVDLLKKESQAQQC